MLAFAVFLFVAVSKKDDQSQVADQSAPEALGASEPAKTEPPEDSAGENWRAHKINGGEWYGTTSKELHEKLTTYAVQEDSAAFGQLLSAGLQSGQATRFDDGEKVLLMDTAFFSGLVKVRREGEILEYWTNHEAIK